MAKSNKDVLGTEVFNQQAYQENDKQIRIQAEAERRKQRFDAFNKWHKSKWKAHPAQMFVTEGLIATPIALGAINAAGGTARAVSTAAATGSFAGFGTNLATATGLTSGAALAGGAVSVGAILHGTRKSIRSANDGMSAFQQGVNWIKYAGLSEFSDERNGLVQKRYQYYSNVKMQNLERNSRDAVLSWFGLDSEYKPRDFISQDNAEDEQSFHNEMEKQKQKDDMEARKKHEREMYIPMMVSTIAMQLLRDPDFRRYMSMHHLDNEVGPSNSDTYYEQQAKPFTDAKKANKQYQEEPDVEGRPGPDGNTNYGNGPSPDGPEPDGPVGLDGSGGNALALPYDEDNNWGHFVDPEVAYAQAQISNEMRLGLPDFYTASQNATTGWKDMPNEVLCQDIQTLRDFGKLDCLMRGIEDGTVCTIDDLREISDTYEKNWAEIEQNGVMPLYGDRIKSYMAELKVEQPKALTTETPVITAEPVEAMPEEVFDSKLQAIEVGQSVSNTLGIEDKSDFQVTSVKMDKDAKRREFLANRAAAREALNADKAKLEKVAPAVEQKPQEPTIRNLLKGAVSSPAFHRGAEAVLRATLERQKLQSIQQADTVYVESSQAEVSALEDESNEKNIKNTVVEIQQDEVTYGEIVAGRNEDEAQVKNQIEARNHHHIGVSHDIAESQTDLGAAPVMPEMPQVAVTVDGQTVETSPKNNGYIPASMRDVMEASEAEYDNEYNS